MGVIIVVVIQCLMTLYVHQVVDTETWVQDLPASNLGGGDSAPAWYKLYTASTDLEMEGFTPQDWDSMVRRLASDQEYYDKVALTTSLHMILRAVNKISRKFSQYSKRLFLLLSASHGESI